MEDYAVQKKVLVHGHANGINKVFTYILPNISFLHT